MAVRPRKNRSPFRFISPIASLALAGYFAFHAFHGEYGIRAHINVKADLAERQATLASLTDQRHKMESRIALLKAGTMERDMIDEYLRRQLSMVHPQDVVLMLD